MQIPRLRPARRNGARSFRHHRRGAAAVEMALVVPVFLTFLLTLFEVAYDQFLQGVLESTVQYTAYQMQVGNTENSTLGPDGATFVKSALCQNVIATLLNCNSLYVRVQQINVNDPTCTNYIYDATDGNRPVSAGVLQLGLYSGAQALPGGNSTQIGPTRCELNSATGPQGVGFCNPGPNEFIVLTAIYVTPSFLYALFPGQSYSFSNHAVRAMLATSAFYTEGFTPASNVALPC